jgi:CMP-N-acetylneuraminate monooxygenase
MIEFEVSPLEHEITERAIILPKTDLPEGLSVHDNLLVVRNGDVIRSYDRRCDHNGGQLISKPGTCLATCPLHGWEFDILAGQYTNVAVKKETLPVRTFDDRWEIGIRRVIPRLPALSGGSRVSVRWLNHACLVVESEGVKFATDPWLRGPAFCNGWWLKYQSPADALAELNSCDFIYVSHNHPDHLHAETLSAVRKDMPIVTAGFETRSSEMYLRDLGFPNVLPAEFGRRYTHAKSNLTFTVLKSGDFRDDSGLYFTVGEFTAILAVDANFLNFHMLPSPVSLLATAFASGASGFPLCFDQYSDEEKNRILARNRSAIATSARQYIDQTKPRVYLPYAGYFAEDPIRDSMVASKNRKNTPASLKPICDERGVRLVNPEEKDEMVFQRGALVEERRSTPLLTETPDASYYERATQHYGDIGFDEIEVYFRSSGFKDDLILFVAVTDEAFEPSDIYRIDFRGAQPNVEACEAPPNLDEVHRQTGARTKYARVRKEAFVDTLRNQLPWEDLAIGFQGRFSRVPNIYNSDFWFHFTNVHIKQNARRAIRNCGGSCQRIEASIY